MRSGLCVSPVRRRRGRRGFAPEPKPPEPAGEAVADSDTRKRGGGGGGRSQGGPDTRTGSKAIQRGRARFRLPLMRQAAQSRPPWSAKANKAPHGVFGGLQGRSPFGGKGIALFGGWCTFRRGSWPSRVSVSPYFSPMGGTPIYLPLYLSVSYVGRSFHPLPSAVLCLHQEEMLLE